LSEFECVFDVCVRVCVLDGLTVAEIAAALWWLVPASRLPPRWDEVRGDGKTVVSFLRTPS
jgi:hypothetical protein